MVEKCNLRYAFLLNSDLYLTLIQQFKKIKIKINREIKPECQNIICMEENIVSGSLFFFCRQPFHT